VHPCDAAGHPGQQGRVTDEAGQQGHAQTLLRRADLRRHVRLAIGELHRLVERENLHLHLGMKPREADEIAHEQVRTDSGCAALPACDRQAIANVVPVEHLACLATNPIVTRISA
jgi:hypothetical protein